jgi:hypothetical protein
MTVTLEEKMEWFGGNVDAVNMFDMLITLSHVWDDLIDKDNPVSDADINNAFRIALINLPANNFYRHIQNQMLPLWVVIISAYETANTYEKAKDEHGIEIAHSLRHAAAHIFAYSIEVCVGQEKSKLYIPKMWKHLAEERVADYIKEHIND